MIVLGAGDEKAVPATKTFSAQLAAFALLGEALGPVPWAPGDLDAVPGQRRVGARRPRAGRMAAAAVDADGLIAVGRGFLLSVALEAALKLKETALLLAEGLSSADFRHGPIAVMEHAFPVLALSAAGARRRGHGRARGARCACAAARCCGSRPTRRPSCRSPATPEALTPIVAVVRAQQLAREVALARGHDPDAPPGSVEGHADAMTRRPSRRSTSAGRR